MPITTFEEFTATWLEEITEGQPSTVQLGNRFARKLLSQWLDLDESSDIVFCDGAGDGGIDAAYLELAESVDASTDAPAEGDTWYLVQSKYGSAFQGANTIVTEGRKVIDTLAGVRPNLSSLAQHVLERLHTFRDQAGPRDKIVLVFATVAPLSDDDKRAMDDVLVVGRNRLGDLFDVSAVSVHTIYQRAVEADQQPLIVNLDANVVAPSKDLLVGTVTLTNLYQFLKDYRAKVGDLDQIYDKNVRRFLGSRRKVNRGITQTLQNDPEKFGLYNNGITIVVADFQSQNGSTTLQLLNPYIVNGCQTTKTIWEVCQARFDAGGTGVNPAQHDWRTKMAESVVVTKVVRVGGDGEELLGNITRYTNSQNAVSDKDFLALQNDFRTWHNQMAHDYDIFLEIQRGGWDSQRALQKHRPAMRQFTKHAYAFDLLKVYGSGWLGEAGVAFSRNADFLPDGPVYKRIMAQDGQRPFGTEDLYAAYLLQGATDQYHFGRGAEELSRRQTRFLFYLVILDLLRDVIHRTGHEPANSDLTTALLKLEASPDAKRELLDHAIQAIDEYMRPGNDDCVHNEPAFRDIYNQNLNGFLKWEKLGSPESTPRLHNLIATYQRLMGRRSGDHPSPREVITQAISR